MEHTAFHLYVAALADHMPGWMYDQALNRDSDGELKSTAALTHHTGAGLWVGRDDYRKRISVHVETRLWHEATRQWLSLNDERESDRMTVAQGRDATAVAREIVRKLESIAIDARDELAALALNADADVESHRNGMEQLADAGAEVVGARDTTGVAYLRVKPGHRFCGRLVGNRVTLGRITLSVDEAVQVFAVLAGFDPED